MLAPNAENLTADLGEAARVLRAINSFALACLSARLAQQQPPRKWIDDVQSRLDACRIAANAWLVDQPDIVSAVYTAFSEYTSLLSAVSQSIAPANSSQDWRLVLKDLQECAQKNLAATKSAAGKLDGHYASFKEVHRELQVVHDEAKAAENSEREEMADISGKLGQIFRRLDELGADTSWSTVETSKQVTKTAISISYKVVTAEATVAVPYFDIVASAYSSGSSLYTLIKEDAEIHDLLHEVAQLMTRLKADARGLVMVDTLMIALDRMNDAYADANDKLPKFYELWDDESRKIGAYVDGLEAGANPAELDGKIQLKDAAAVWKALVDAATGLVLPEVSGPEVVKFDIQLPALP